MLFGDGKLLGGSGNQLYRGGLSLEGIEIANRSHSNVCGHSDLGPKTPSFILRVQSLDN